MTEPTAEEYAVTYGVPPEIILRADRIARETERPFVQAIDLAIREKQAEEKT